MSLAAAPMPLLLDDDYPDLLAWARLDESVAGCEERFSAVGLTLSTAAVWGGDSTVREWLRGRSAWRLNPVLSRIEEAVSAFAYQAQGGEHRPQEYRTKSTPREACGPELRTLLYDRLESVTAVELRLLPRFEERWWSLSAREPSAVLTLVRRMLLAGCPYRSLWLQGKVSGVSFAGAMAATHAVAWGTEAEALGVKLEPGHEPVMRTAHRGYHPLRKTWATVTPADTIVLADAWSVLVK